MRVTIDESVSANTIAMVPVQSRSTRRAFSDASCYQACLVPKLAHRSFPSPQPTGSGPPGRLRRDGRRRQRPRVRAVRGRCGRRCRRKLAVEQVILALLMEDLCGELSVLQDRIPVQSSLCRVDPTTAPCACQGFCPSMWDLRVDSSPDSNRCRRSPATTCGAPGCASSNARSLQDRKIRLEFFSSFI